MRIGRKDGRGRRSGIELNAATGKQLQRLPFFDQAFAAEVLRLRPFASWEAFRQITGADEEFVRRLRNAGARLGWPGVLKGTSDRDVVGTSVIKE